MLHLQIVVVYIMMCSHVFLQIISLFFFLLYNNQEFVHTPDKPGYKKDSWLSLCCCC